MSRQPFDPDAQYCDDDEIPVVYSWVEWFLHVNIDICNGLCLWLIYVFLSTTTLDLNLWCYTVIDCWWKCYGSCLNQPFNSVAVKCSDMELCNSCMWICMYGDGFSVVVWWRGLIHFLISVPILCKDGDVCNVVTVSETNTTTKIFYNPSGTKI